jgi:Na+:H+ antiporter, NhaA family
MTAEHDSPNSRLHAFIHHESTAGLLLVLAAVAAIAVYNFAPLRPIYDHVLHADYGLSIGGYHLHKSVLHWIDDGLMAIFFFLVGLELKREIREGNLSTPSQIVLPAMAAFGGMMAPAMIYVLVTLQQPELSRGWAIPAATDIAFALGALSLAGSRVPASLKVFLLTLATLDDLGAIVIIALFYTASLSGMALALAVVALWFLWVMNKLGVEWISPYLVVGLALWVFVLESGIHATLAGVALALAIPLRKRDGTPIVARIEEALHPYVKFLILPLFAFANAGIPLENFPVANINNALPQAIALGLVIGKPVGIGVMVAIAVKLGLARLPEGCSRLHMLGVGCLAGIGFTMSLFIGSLAFAVGDETYAVRVGVIAGSVVSTLLGIAVLKVAGRKAA